MHFGKDNGHMELGVIDLGLVRKELGREVSYSGRISWCVRGVSCEICARSPEPFAKMPWQSSLAMPWGNSETPPGPASEPSKTV